MWYAYYTQSFLIKSLINLYFVNNLSFFLDARLDTSTMRSITFKTRYYNIGDQE